MIVMDVKINNFFAFRDFHMNMSYPKKIVNSYIENEYLKERPNFRYKKVNILMGANATGKTSFGQMLMIAFNFIQKKEFSYIANCVCDKSKEAYFAMDFILEDFTLYSMQLIIHPMKNEEYTDENIDLKIDQIKINKKDSYESCKKRMLAKNNDEIRSMNYIEELEKLNNLSWLFIYPEKHNKIKISKDKYKDIYLMVLEKTLKALDPSIYKIEELNNVEDSYVIRMNPKDVIIQEGSVVNESILSSGTKSGIEIAKLVASILTSRNEFYYCDEKFSYVHSDIEKAFLSIMIESLGDNEQLFFTTHNMDILDLSLPKHSFTFMKKDVNDEECPIKCISADEILKRNTDSLKAAVKNDLFCAAPNVTGIKNLIFNM